MDDAPDTIPYLSSSHGIQKLNCCGRLPNRFCPRHGPAPCCATVTWSLALNTAGSKQEPLQTALASARAQVYNMPSATLSFPGLRHTRANSLKWPASGMSCKRGGARKFLLSSTVGYPPLAQGSAAVKAISALSVIRQVAACRRRDMPAMSRLLDPGLRRCECNYRWKPVPSPSTIAFKQSLLQAKPASNKTIQRYYHFHLAPLKSMGSQGL